MEIIEKIKDFVENECKKPTSKYGYEPFVNHFIPVVNYALELADKFGADKEIIEISAWLHDIGSIMYGREDHHITGAKIAEEKLNELGYPHEKIEKVKNCILHHRGSKDFETESIEEQILVEADALSAFDDLSGLFQSAFIFESKTRNEANESILKKYRNKWNQLHFEKSKEIVKPKYEAILLLLS